MDTLLEVCLGLDVLYEDDAEFGRHVRSQLGGFKYKYSIVQQLISYDPMYCPHYLKRIAVKNTGKSRVWNKDALARTSVQTLKKALNKLKENKDETSRT